MCLLVQQFKDTVFDDDFLKGVYQLNSDGLGVMFANENGINIVRCVPKTESDFINFYRNNIEGKDCAWHARMRTHGDIDLVNCHPYEVLNADDGYPIFMAHNGVLSMGNKADTTKSDTWHYIQNFLRPLLIKNPEFFMTEAFRELIQTHIGYNNKFILMDAFGNTVTLNERAGVTHNGAWLSNTYAWDTTGTKFDYKPTYPAVTGGNSWSKYARTPYKSSFGIVDDEDDWDNYPIYQSSKETKETKEAAKSNALDDEYDHLVDIVADIFEAASEFGLCLDDVSWIECEEYVAAVGFEFAEDLAEAIMYGCYTERELVSELLQYCHDDADDTGNLADVYEIGTQEERATA
jgi:hypothetical protein